MTRSLYPVRRLVLVCAVLSMPVTASVQSLSSGERIGRYDFAYQVTAANRVRPVQVFDDGQNTYFQFLGGDAVPAIFRITEDGPELTTQSFEGPYIRVDGIGSQYMLRLGSATGRVVYTAPGRAAWPGVPAAGASPATPWTKVVASAAPVALSPSEARPRAIDTNSYATPARGDTTRWAHSREESEEHEFAFPKGSDTLSRSQVQRIEKIASMLTGEFHVVVIGRDDQDLKEGMAESRSKAIGQALKTRGVPDARIEYRSASYQKGTGDTAASHIQILRTTYRDIQPPRPAVIVAAPAAPMSESPPNGFTFEKTDQTIGGAIRRWAAATQYQIVWEMPKDVDPQITTNSRLTADSMRQAMEMVAAGMKSKGYDMQVSIYRNRVIRVSTSN